jgi:hypothetical protein
MTTPTVTVETLLFRHKGHVRTATTLEDLSREFVTFAAAFRISPRRFSFAQVWNSDGDCVALIYLDGTVTTWDGAEVVFDPARAAFDATCIEGEFTVVAMHPPCVAFSGVSA